MVLIRHNFQFIILFEDKRRQQQPGKRLITRLEKLDLLHLDSLDYDNALRSGIQVSLSPSAGCFLLGGNLPNTFKTLSIHSSI